jgi:hypothetical protein
VKSALQAARMTGARFDSYFSDTPLPKDESEVTEFIKRRTEIYRETWIIKPLEAALKKLEKKKKDGTT